MRKYASILLFLLGCTRAPNIQEKPSVKEPIRVSSNANKLWDDVYSLADLIEEYEDVPSTRLMQQITEKSYVFSSENIKSITDKESRFEWLRNKDRYGHKARIIAENLKENSAGILKKFNNPGEVEKAIVFLNDPRAKAGIITRNAGLIALQDAYTQRAVQYLDRSLDGSENAKKIFITHMLEAVYGQEKSVERDQKKQALEYRLKYDVDRVLRGERKMVVMREWDDILQETYKSHARINIGLLAGRREFLGIWVKGSIMHNSENQDSVKYAPHFGLSTKDGIFRVEIRTLDFHDVHWYGANVQ
jgi:hypothetical protein